MSKADLTLLRNAATEALEWNDEETGWWRREHWWR
jgi:hypothetical protein